jgi:uncharacterized OB-fold protein
MNVVALAQVIPRYVRYGVPVEGPDEDAFTLAVEAARRLGTVRGEGGSPSRPLPRRVSFFVPRPSKEIPFGDASDLRGESIEFEVHGLADLPLALTERLTGTAGGEEWLIASLDNGETGGSSHAAPAGAMAAALSGDPGLVAGEMRSFPWKGRGHPLDPGLRTTLASMLSVRASDGQPWAQAYRWDDESLARTFFPGTAISSSGAPGSPSPPPSPFSRPGYPLRPLAVLWDAVQDSARGIRRSMWIRLEPHRLSVWGIHVDAPVPLGGNPRPGEPVIAVEDAAWRSRSRVALSSVSEGAYVSGDRYRSGWAGHWRLEGTRCRRCGRYALAATDVCRFCGSPEVEPSQLSREGARLEAITTIHKGAQPTEFDWMEDSALPYQVGLVRFPEGHRLSLQITDTPPGSARPGDAVELVLRRIYPQEGSWRYGLKAVVRRDIPRDGTPVEDLPGPPEGPSPSSTSPPPAPVRRTRRVRKSSPSPKPPEGGEGEPSRPEEPLGPPPSVPPEAPSPG